MKVLIKNDPHLLVTLDGEPGRTTSRNPATSLSQLQEAEVLADAIITLAEQIRGAGGKPEDAVEVDISVRAGVSVSSKK
jgi:hypothetical protein